jgi:hypothetical protein
VEAAFKGLKDDQSLRPMAPDLPRRSLLEKLAAIPMLDPGLFRFIPKDG